MANIGFIGLGHMGLPMAINLVNAGHSVKGFDLQLAPQQELLYAGGGVATDVQDAVTNQNILITMLQTGDQVEQICLGEKGAYHYMRPLAMHIDCSTIDVTSSRRLHQAATDSQLLSLDAPVSGGVLGATAGTLTFMAGGTLQAFEQAHSILAIMGKKIFHTGDAGSGQAAKICNNMILGVSMIAVSEAFILAKNLGLSAEKLFNVVNNSSGQCWVLSQYPPVPNLLPQVPSSHDYQAGFAAAMMLKDLLLSQASANQTDSITPLGELATSLYQAFVNEGNGHVDFSAIIKSFEHEVKRF